MKKYSRVFIYLAKFKASIAWYFINIILSIVFSILSIGMLLPFMQLIFGVKDQTVAKTSGNPVVEFVNRYLNDLINSGTVFHALGIVCVLIIVSIFFKNLFLYLSYRVMGPVKTGIVNRFRVDMYNKVLRLPIGYFTEQRKGDLMSRMISDVGEAHHPHQFSRTFLYKSQAYFIYFTLHTANGFRNWPYEPFIKKRICAGGNKRWRNHQYY
jgi:subfamily B ATP-binding cassette protein MsbA